MVTRCIRKTGAGFGVQTERIPFDALGTKQRVARLNEMHAAVYKKHKSGDEDDAKQLTRDAYYHLRLAWERAVEEVLLDGVVQRFTEGVSTKRLCRVTVDDADFSAIDAGMTKSSKFEHDGAASAHLPTPHPDELKQDIESLEDWRRKVIARQAEVEKKRKS
jgi:hypothetical protein